MIDKKALGQRIRAIRLKLGLTMEDFIERIDNKPGRGRSGTVNNWETGKNAPNKQRLKKIAKLGGVSVEYLINGNHFSAKEALELLEKSINYDEIKGLQLSNEDKKKVNAVRLEGAITANQILEFNKKKVLKLLDREREYVDKVPIGKSEAEVYNGFISLLELLRLHGSPDQQIDFESVVVSMWQIANGNMEYDKDDFLPNIDKLLSSFPIKKDNSDKSK